jgi:hypothetical protein
VKSPSILNKAKRSYYKLIIIKIKKTMKSQSPVKLVWQMLFYGKRGSSNVKSEDLAIHHHSSFGALKSDERRSTSLYQPSLAG